jgi:hypothetical protein
MSSLSSVVDWIINHWLSQEKFWVALGSIVTSIAFIYTWKKPQKEENVSVKNLKVALASEISTNIGSAFLGGVDRPFLYHSIEQLRGSYAHRIAGNDEFKKLQVLYLNFQHHERIIAKFYGVADRRYATESQLKLCNQIIEYFEGISRQVVYDMGELNGPSSGKANKYIEEKLSETTKIYIQNGSSIWDEKIKQNLDIIFI